MDFLIDVANAVLEASGMKERLLRNEQVIRLKQRFGLENVESLNTFEDVYAYALVEYAFDAEGLCKHRLIVEFFKAKAVRDVFRVAYRDSDPAGWLRKGQAIAQYELGDQLPVGIEPKRELGVFAAVFLQVVKETRSPTENLQAQQLETVRAEVAQSLRTIQAQLQQLPTLEAINQQINQLSGAPSSSQTLALPAAAQTSNAADLAHQLGEWFEVLDYDRDRDYEKWTTDYFEWVINFPLTRRKFSRVLVRGVAGVVEMADLQDFAQAVELTRANEGWLVGNRRVSQATRRAAREESIYEDISCYTFDELVDEDADFSKYLDWLEAEIKAKKVDTEYLSLACRKDELDPTSQRKIGVSAYAEEDGWIDGYVDMWLDDPAKEHLSILGEFGTGKTWFALHYAWVALQQYRQAKQRGTERPRIPVVVPLRDYAKAVSVESLFSEFFFRKHEILKSYSVFEQLNRMGKLLLIFDGFDEMAARVNRQAMIDNFWELAKVVVPGAKAILTCRTEHFPDAIEGRRLLNAELKASTADRTGEPPQFEVLELEKFSDEQIEALLSRKAKAETVQQVVGNAQLLDLARRPVMVDLILEALPDIEAGKPVDMARVYLYAVTRKMEKDIKSERTFTSMADKLYFLCELSWEMLSTNRMSLNYRDFPERLEQLFTNRVKEEKELDHWRYDMMGQTMLIRNSEGDYSPAHRSLLEFFVAYKIVASLGAMAEDFTAVAREQSYLDEALQGRDYKWDEYFKRACDDDGVPEMMPPLDRFYGKSFSELLPLLSGAKIAKAVLDLAHSMLSEETVRSQLLPLLQATAKWSMQEVGYFGGNVAQLMLARSPHALMKTQLKGVKLRGVNFNNSYLTQVDLQDAQFAESIFSKALGSVWSSDYSPDGTKIAVGDHRGTLQVWNLATEQVISLCLGHTAGINSVAYRSDGRQIATGSDDNTVKLWDPESGECVYTLNRSGSWIGTVKYSPDGKQLATGGGDNTVKLWDLESNKCVRELKGHEERVLSVAYAPDGMQLASGSGDNEIKLWNTMSGKCTQTLQGHEDWVKSVAYSPDRKQLASGSNDSTVKIWDLESHECNRTLREHTAGINSIAYRPDGKQLATGDIKSKIKLWNLTSGECVRTLHGHKGWVKSLVYRHDGQQLASVGSDSTVRLWNPESNDCILTIQSHESRVLSVVYSPDENHLASSSSDGTVKLWNPTTGECKAILQNHERWVWSVVYSLDGKQLASSSSDGTVKLWNPTTGECSATLQGNKSRVWSVAYSPVDRQQLASSNRKNIKLWNPVTGKRIATLKAHRDEIRSIVYRPDGQQLASGSNDKTVKLWNLTTGECTITLEGHEDFVIAVTYSPDGQQIASGSSDKTIKLWDVTTGVCTMTLRGHESWISSVVYSPDGRHLASGSADTTVNLWDVTTGSHIDTLSGHNGLTNSLTYNMEGHLLTSGSYDGMIRIWDMNSRECLRVIDDRVCAGLNITNTIGLTAGQRTALKLMGAIDHNDG